nr:glycosyltransferase [Chloroflexota bacterium]
MIGNSTETVSIALPRPSISLVIPAYNEAHRIGATIDASIAYLRTWGAPIELLLVDDGSDDETASISYQRSEVFPELRVISIAHAGKAAALRTGLVDAKFDLVGFSDADLATPLAYLERLSDTIAAGSDIAIGSREGSGSRRIGEPMIRHIMG